MQFIELVISILFTVVTLPKRIFRAVFCRPSYRFYQPRRERWYDRTARYDGSIMEQFGAEHPLLSKVLLVVIGGTVFAILLSRAAFGFLA